MGGVEPATGAGRFCCVGDTEQDDLTPEQAERLQVLREQVEDRRRDEEKTRFWATTDVTRRGHTLTRATMAWDITRDQLAAWIAEDETEARRLLDAES